MGSVTYTSRADTETIVKDAEDHGDVATTEKIICVSIVSVKVIHKQDTMHGAGAAAIAILCFKPPYE